jgi:hypothetical protein
MEEVYEKLPSNSLLENTPGRVRILEKDRMLLGRTTGK